MCQVLFPLFLSQQFQYPTVEITIIEGDLQLTFEAATIKATHKLSYADAHMAALVLHLNATVLTEDKEFNNLKDIKDFKVKQIA